MTPIISDPSDSLGARRQADQALAVPVEPEDRLDPSGFDPSRMVADQERRWVHLIEFAESSRRARAAEKAAGENQ